MFKSTLIFLGAPFAERPNDKKYTRNKINKIISKKKWGYGSKIKPAKPIIVLKYK